MHTHTYIGMCPDVCVYIDVGVEIHMNVCEQAELHKCICNTCNHEKYICKKPHAYKSIYASGYIPSLQCLSAHMII